MAKKRLKRDVDHVDPHDSPVFRRILSLLKRWSWDSGLKKIEEEMENSHDEQECDIFRFFLGWMAGERGRNKVALAHFSKLTKSNTMNVYALAGQAFICYRKREKENALKLITKAREKMNNTLGQTRPASCLHATLDHCEAIICIGDQDHSTAHNLLSDSLRRYGKEHFATGRVLDSFGQLYSIQNRFFDAEKFYLLALEHKERFQDDIGSALTHGQLGRLYLSWGKLERAEKHFKLDLNISHRLGDIRGLAQIYNFLAIVFFEKGLNDEALAYVTESLRWNDELGEARQKSFALKDEAAILLACDNVEAADKSCKLSEKLIGDRDPFLLAHINRVWGAILRRMGDWKASELKLHESIGYFEQNLLHDEAAKSILELSKTLRSKNSQKVLVSDCLLRALEQADRAKRPFLINRISESLAIHDETTFQKRQLERVQGPGLHAHGILDAPKTEFASVIFLDVRDYTPFVRAEDATTVMTFMNQLFDEMNGVLEKYDIFANQYLGDGFMAICRGKSHSRRAVESSFELLRALGKVNQPRTVLGLSELQCRIGIACGSLLSGYVGTWRKVDYTAVGATTNLASRLQSLAPPNGVCLSNETYRRIKGKLCLPKPEKVKLKPKGFEDEGAQLIWKFSLS